MKEEINFEKAFERLDEILNEMNDGKVSLDSSLKLFEEANKLIVICQKNLLDAEKKIEILIKDRNGEPEIENGEPKKEFFNTAQKSILD
ncbi:MAG: exodeoxyribonuclease VII small subunit [Chlamydiae bacterium RIFCSPLOWO2_01_FULL_28_7]|nr:MAG: exodeoxyribonuclease VII small subunit [Chlamydiae bacterium RIFCSPLOWO2_01_FULL_28_7]